MRFRLARHDTTVHDKTKRNDCLHFYKALYIKRLQQAYRNGLYMMIWMHRTERTAIMALIQSLTKVYCFYKKGFGRIKGYLNLINSFLKCNSMPHFFIKNHSGKCFDCCLFFTKQIANSYCEIPVVI